jgi:hypothetical protein
VPDRESKKLKELKELGEYMPQLTPSTTIIKKEKEKKIIKESLKKRAKR